MLLNITTTHQPATDLGYLLHKHPAKCQTFPMTFGQAHVFYPKSTPEKCTATLLLEIDPVVLVRGKLSGREGSLFQYVNDRPYVASSFMSVAISKVFRTALSRRCKNLPELAERKISLEAHLPVLPCRGGISLLKELFEPLGYEIEAKPLPLDETPQWQNSVYFDVTLSHNIRLADLLSHLYVLIPVLDDDKHYWVGDEEIEKLLRHGEGWLNTHPYKEQITQRYLKRRWSLAKKALAQLTEEDSQDLEEKDLTQNLEEAAIEKPISLNQQRLELVGQTLAEYQVKRVIDLGCGEGKLLKQLLKNKTIEKITGVDVSYRSLEIAKKRLKLDDLPFHQQDKIELIQGSLTYRDKRFNGYDGATLIEVVEHLDPNRLAALKRVVFEFARPKLVVVTTPNVEYNVLFKLLPNNKLRHRDHRFEWTRKEFRDWANDIAQEFNYQVTFQGIGDENIRVGTPTQMAIFRENV